MPHATTLSPYPGLQAMVLCGPGTSLDTFTSQPADSPKALIPCANRPLIWYALTWLTRAGIHDVVLVTPPEAAAPLEKAMKTDPCLTGFRGVGVLAPAGLEMNTGTAELLRLPEVQDVVKGDFVILPCDLVSEVEGGRLIQQWLTLNPSGPRTRQQKGGLALFYPTHNREGISAPKKDETDFLASVPLPSPTVPSPAGSLREGIEEIVTVMPTDTLNDTLEEKKAHLPIRHTLLTRHKRVKLRTKWRDAHVYVFPHWVMEFVKGNEGFESLGEDVLGWWAKAGWQQGLATKLGLDEVLAGKKRGEGGDGGDESEDGDVDASALSSTKSAAAPQAQTPTFAARVGQTAAFAPRQQQHTTVVPPLLAYIQPLTPGHPLIRRVDTTPQLASLSLYLARLPSATEHPLTHEHKIHPTASIGAQTRISSEDCLIGENVRMGWRCNIKESVVGANCTIGGNCVIMEGVAIGDGVTLTGCIGGRRARIEGVPAPATGEGEGDGAQGAGKGKKGKGREGDEGEEMKMRLTDCEVAPYYVVEAGTEEKGRTMKGFGTDALDGGEEGEEDEDGDGGEDDDDDGLEDEED
ncbi:Translation initiation factor eIF-2B subunit gamma [Teratosphaeriaceae sp. CCFEE 6253]|nr:Translation initiation factor eIF-2B subunit gamma [Teratosphaeriaceae sp. CCFEE 6253]